MDKKLTPKQERFCMEYLIDFNATQASIRAGYSKKTAGQIGEQNLKKLEIQSFISKLQSDTASKLEITREKIVAEYAKIGFFDIRKVLTVDGGLKPTTDWDDESAAAIAGLESYDEIHKESGETQGKVRKIKVADKKGALDSLCRVLGYNAPEKRQYQKLDKDGNPVDQLPATVNVTLNLD